MGPVVVGLRIYKFEKTNKKTKQYEGKEKQVSKIDNTIQKLLCPVLPKHVLRDLFVHEWTTKRCRFHAYLSSVIHCNFKKKKLFCCRSYTIINDDDEVVFALLT